MSPTITGAVDAAALYRVRNGVRAVLSLGVAASVAANVLHAQDNVVGRVIAAWPPLALLLTVELISRIPAHRRWLAVVRVIATAAVAGIAAWVSYWHMVEVCLKYGEGAVSARLIPLSVDGLVVVASICLVEVNGRIRAVAAVMAAAADLAPTPVTAPAVAPVVPAQAEPALLVAPTPALPAAGGSPGAQRVHGEPEGGECDGRVDEPAGRASAQQVVGRDKRIAKADEQHADSSQAQRLGSRGAGASPPLDTAVAVARIRRTSPSLSTAEIAARLEVHPSTVRRYLAAAKKPSTTTTSTQARTNRPATSTDNTNTDAPATDITDATAPVAA